MPELTGSRCRCGVCKRTFRNLAAFDAHGPHRGGCGDPTAVGLVEQGGIWATPEGHAAADGLRQRLETVRTSRSPVAQTAEEATTR